MRCWPKILNATLCLLLMLLVSAVSAFAQSDVVATGGSGTGSGGTLDFSFGQVFDSYEAGVDNTLTEGVQQTYCVPSWDTIEASVCEGLDFVMPGFSLQANVIGGIGMHVFTHAGLNRGGCDSTVTLLLNVFPVHDIVETVTACNGYTWHGTTYNYSTDAPSYQLTNRFGCDSTVTLNLTINESTSSVVEEQGEESFFYHNTNYTRSGTYHDTLVNAAGCDSVVTLKLCLMNPLPQIVSYNRQVVMVNHYPDGPGTTRVDYKGYQWYKDGEIILGATGDYYSEPGYAGLRGVYSVKVPNNEKSCFVHSNYINMINVVDVDEADADEFAFEVSPNPVRSGWELKVTVNPGEKVRLEDLSMRIYDMNGRTLFERKHLTEQVFSIFPDYVAGQYAVELVSDKGGRKVKKLVVIR